ncbi:NUDIX domain-containing protein [Sphingobacterium sp. UT-1RO-CII-1]|uniref:NUDIX hydrolase n=1 Tax=Sphingobacterium sp. UT-1RO-CII-1 TaxID=2995225 RepID=UPI00227A9D37|nr:NUDIX domain-containing protein [Sphingobacterium sp. UT-1RO-CII-1]MCY4780170.1 NUDIX domain-containing protein [Sphingobacterium sp. UT-1RO-CII-1]
MNESQLILADFIIKNTQNVQTIGLQDLDLYKLFKASQQKVTKEIIHLYIHPEVDKVFDSLIQNSHIIKAAGGLVKNGDGDYLFIERLGKWDLPKGKVENGEKMREAAIREVEEECGLKINYLGPKLTTTYHTYQVGDKLVLKQTNWYEMGVNDAPKLIPQLEEDITKAKWLKKSDFQKVLKNTYPLIADILKKV